MYTQRTYRNTLSSAGRAAFTVQEKETDLYITADRDLSEEAYLSVLAARSEIESIIERFPFFLTAMTPIEIKEATPLVQKMIKAAGAVGTGPMSAVAGAVAEYVGRELLAYSREVMVENGGDIWFLTREEIKVEIFAGLSPLSGKIALRLPPQPKGLGVCTSSGSVGPSISYGRADAVVLSSFDAALADAVATAAGNIVQTPDDVGKAVEFCGKIPGVNGALAICGMKMAVWGNLELVKP